MSVYDNRYSMDITYRQISLWEKNPEALLKNLDFWKAYALLIDGIGFGIEKVRSFVKKQPDNSPIFSAFSITSREEFLDEIDSHGPEFLGSLDSKELADFEKLVLGEFSQFGTITASLLLWCDAVTKTVSPDPIWQLYRRYARATGYFARRARLREKRGELSELKIVNDDEVSRSAIRESSDSLTAALHAIYRLESLALLEYYRKRDSGELPAKTLVTSDDVAKIMHRSERTMESYRKEWPIPDVPHRGNLPQQWAWSNLRPVLVTQFPGEKIPDDVPNDIG